MNNVDQQIILGFLENDHGQAVTQTLLATHPLCQEFEIAEPPLLAAFDNGVRFIIRQDGGLIPLSKGVHS